MVKALTFKEALDKAMSYCGRAEHCVSDVKSKLIQWRIPEEYVDAIIQKLIEDRFVDEKRFAEMYIREKIMYASWGRVKIAHALAVKRVSDQIYKPILETFDYATYELVAEKSLTAKWRQIKAKDFYEKKAKLFRFAMGRGFETYVVQAWLEKNKE